MKDVRLTLIFMCPAESVEAAERIYENLHKILNFDKKVRISGNVMIALDPCCGKEKHVRQNNQLPQR